MKRSDTMQIDVEEFSEKRGRNATFQATATINENGSWRVSSSPDHAERLEIAETMTPFKDMAEYYHDWRRAAL